MTGGATLRPATPQDLPALAAVYAHCARTLGPLVYTTEQVQAWERFAADAPAFREYVLGADTWVAEEDGTVVGFCGVDAQGEVRSLYVRPEWARRGLALWQLQAALGRARERGLTRFAAWATPFSRPVFERAGLSLVRVVREDFQGVEFDRYRVETG